MGLHEEPKECQKLGFIQGPRLFMILIFLNRRGEEVLRELDPKLKK